MKYRKFGNTDLKVSELGYGTMRYASKSGVEDETCAEGEPKRLADFDSVIEPLAEIFDKMKQEGKVRYLTTFPYTVGYAKRAVESGTGFYRYPRTDGRAAYRPSLQPQYTARRRPVHRSGV